jgi:hypothetical protein
MMFQSRVTYVVSREPDVTVRIFHRLAGEPEVDFCVLSAIAVFWSREKYPTLDIVLGSGP